MMLLRFAVITLLFNQLYLVSYGQNILSKTRYTIPESGEEILKLDSKINLYQAGDFYISGQPNDSVLRLLKEKNLHLVINVRTPQEMALLKKEGFDEEALLDSLSISYVNVPIGGEYGFNKEAILEINNVIKQHKGNVMIHCRSAGRATNAWMAWLINYQNIPVNDAILLGREMQFNLYLEDLLGYELLFDKKLK